MRPCAPSDANPQSPLQRHLCLSTQKDANDRHPDNQIRPSRRAHMATHRRTRPRHTRRPSNHPRRLGNAMRLLRRAVPSHDTDLRRLDRAKRVLWNDHLSCAPHDAVRTEKAWRQEKLRKTPSRLRSYQKSKTCMKRFPSSERTLHPQRRVARAPDPTGGARRCNASATRRRKWVVALQRACNANCNANATRRKRTAFPKCRLFRNA